MELNETTCHGGCQIAASREKGSEEPNGCGDQCACSCCNFLKTHPDDKADETVSSLASIGWGLDLELNGRTISTRFGMR